ncbi:MAG: glycogen synthase [Candidatus Heteroscillospira sp.]|jgi:starch synthase
MTTQTLRRRLKKLSAAKGLEAPPNILIAAAECAPLAKTGGLADVIGTLPASLRSLGFDARVIIPCHRVIKERYGDKLQLITEFEVRLGWRRQYVGVMLLKLGRVPVYLIDNEFYFGNKIYEDGDFGGEQYAYFCRAVLETLRRIDFVPQLIHCNDWHTAAIPMLLRTQYGGTELEGVRTVFTIHNIAYQGQFGCGFLGDVLEIDPKYHTWEYLVECGCGNLMKSACIFADKVNTVSPSYAAEILTPEYGEGLDKVLRACSGKLSGIVNGIDMRAFDPETDPALPEHFSAAEPGGKGACKDGLCAELGLDGGAPLLSMVTRMTPQKGFDLVIPAMEEILSRGFSFVLLGTGEKRYEDFMRKAELEHPGRVRAVLSYNEELAHRIYAASDFFLMPSKFEPCGISQMLAMRYGALPIVRETGGLRDTVSSYNQYTGEGTGFGFARFDCTDMLSALDRALAAYGDNERLAFIRRSAMESDFSFTSSAFEYAKLYLDTL